MRAHSGLALDGSGLGLKLAGITSPLTPPGSGKKVYGWDGTQWGLMDLPEAEGIADIRYDISAKQLQKKATALSDWEMVAGGQFVLETV